MSQRVAGSDTVCRTVRIQIWTRLTIGSLQRDDLVTRRVECLTSHHRDASSQDRRR